MRSSDINLVTKLGLCIPRRIRRCNSQRVFCTGNEGPKVSKLSFPSPLYDNHILRLLLSVRVCVMDVGVAIMICGSCAKSSRAFQLSQKWPY